MRLRKSVRTGKLLCYGQHLATCPLAHQMADQTQDDEWHHCTCGLREALFIGKPSTPPAGEEAR